MNLESPNPNPLHDFIKHDKWAEILKHFTDVLRINIFIASPEGQVLLPPPENRYGVAILENGWGGLAIYEPEKNFLRKFEKAGNYWEYTNAFGLQIFAIPMNLEENKNVAYMIVGPVALHRRVDAIECKLISRKLNLDAAKILNSLNEIRVVSFVTIKSILDLLSEVTKYILQLNSQGQKFSVKYLPPRLTETAKDIYSSIYLHELLATLLDVALSMTKAECGSIMVLDKKSQMLTIKVSRGIDMDRVKNTHLKIGEGLAGLAAKENMPFVISGTEGNSRIKHLLKRKDIRQALIVPLLTEGSMFGVLNIHTKNPNNLIAEDSLSLVQNLSKLTSAAITSIRQSFSE